MKLIEITVSITTRYLEQERGELIRMIESVIQNKVLLTDDEFASLLEISSTIMKRYNVDDSEFRGIFDAFSDLISYYRANRK